MGTVFGKLETYSLFILHFLQIGNTWRSYHFELGWGTSHRKIITRAGKITCPQAPCSHLCWATKMKTVLFRANSDNGSLKPRQPIKWTGQQDSEEDSKLATENVSNQSH
jgi:hypothetical protein